MARIKVVEANRAEARLYMNKAQQFLDQARSAFTEQHYDAVMLNAVHSAISSCDAVTVALSGRRSADPNHQRAVELLEQTLAKATTGAPLSQLRALLAKKNVVEYESRPATGREASEALKRSERIIAWALGMTKRP